MVELEQKGNFVKGVFTFTEEVKNDYKIDVVEKVEGIISNGRAILRSVEVTAIQGGQKINYLPNNFEVYLVSENKLVGSTYDSENVCGVFTMERK